MLPRPTKIQMANKKLVVDANLVWSQPQETFKKLSTALSRYKQVSLHKVYTHICKVK